MVRCDAAWCGMVRCGAVRCGACVFERWHGLMVDCRRVVGMMGWWVISGSRVSPVLCRPAMAVGSADRRPPPESPLSALLSETRAVGPCVRVGERGVGVGGWVGVELSYRKRGGGQRVVA